MFYLILVLAWLQVDNDLLRELDSDSTPPTGAAKAAEDPAALPADGATDADSEPTPDSQTGEAAEDFDSPDQTEEGESEGSEPAAEGWLGQLDEISQSGALGLIRQGGIFMWPLLLMAVLGTGVIIERYRSLKMLTTDSSDIRLKVKQLLQADEVEQAMVLCDREQGPVPAILSAGLRKFLILRRLDYDAGRIEEQVVKGMDDYSIHIVAALERHLPILATIASAAPMLGFLGTVQGMIFAFNDIVVQMGKVNIVEAAAAGIKVSLLTTCFGLIVGIPAFVAFNYFTSVINRFVLDVEESATDLIEAVTLQLALAKRDS